MSYNYLIILSTKEIIDMGLFVVGIIIFIITFFALGFKREQGIGTKWRVNAKQIISLLGIVIAFTGCIKTVPTGHTGVVTVFGTVEPQTYDAGIHFTAP